MQCVCAGTVQAAEPEVPFQEARPPTALGPGAGAPAADGVYDLGFTPSSAGKHKVKSSKVKSNKPKADKSAASDKEDQSRCVIC